MANIPEILSAYTNFRHDPLDRLRSTGTQGGRACWPRAAPGQRRVLLHAGLHKTGTTAVQRFLLGAAPKLQKQRALYPASGRPRIAPAGHHNIAWQLAGDLRFSPSAGTVDDVAAEIAAFPGDAILSSEDFESMLGEPDRLTPLIEHNLLRNHAITILFYVRNQASYIESLFFELLKHYFREDPDFICREAIERGQLTYEDWTFHFDYDALYTRLVTLPVSVVVLPYSRLAQNSIVFDFLNFTGLLFRGKKLKYFRSNDRVLLTRAFYMFVHSRLDHALANRILKNEAILQLKDVRTAHLSSRSRDRLIARFEEGNQRLARACDFSVEAMVIPRSPPQGSVCLEELFSARALTLLSGFAGDGSETSATPPAMVPGRAKHLQRPLWRIWRR